MRGQQNTKYINCPFTNIFI